MEPDDTPRNGGAALEVVAWVALIVGLMGFCFIMGLALVRLLLS